MKILFIIIFLFITVNAYCDEFRIPFECYPKKVQAQFEESGKKLDLNGNDKDENSWGFIVNQGSHYTIYTYKPVTEEDLNMVMRIMMGWKDDSKRQIGQEKN